MTNTNDSTEATISPVVDSPRRVSRRTMAIMAATVAAVGVVAAPTAVDAVGASPARGSISDQPTDIAEPEPQAPIIVPATLPDVAPSVEPPPPDNGVVDEWGNGDLIGGDWGDCPGCGLG